MSALMVAAHFLLANSLVFDIGNTKIAIGRFQQDHLQDQVRFELEKDWRSFFEEWLENQGELSYALIACVNPKAGEELGNILLKKNIPHTFLQNDSLNSLTLDVDVPEHVGADRLATAYGALKYCSDSCITVDIGTALVFNVIGKGRVFYGGAICPGIGLSAQALKEHTALLPLVSVKKPVACVSRNTEENICSGLYYGLLGTIEKIVSRLQMECFPEAPAKVIATGGIFRAMEEESLANDLKKDLEGIIDIFEPNLNLIGLNEILKEMKEYDDNTKRNCF